MKEIDILQKMLQNDVNNKEKLLKKLYNSIGLIYDASKKSNLHFDLNGNIQEQEHQRQTIYQIIQITHTKISLENYLKFINTMSEYPIETIKDVRIEKTGESTEALNINRIKLVLDNKKKGNE